MSRPRAAAEEVPALAGWVRAYGTSRRSKCAIMGKNPRSARRHRRRVKVEQRLKGRPGARPGPFGPRDPPPREDSATTLHTWRLPGLAGLLDPTPPARSALAPGLICRETRRGRTTCHLCTQLETRGDTARIWTTGGPGHTAKPGGHQKRSAARNSSACAFHEQRRLHQVKKNTESLVFSHRTTMHMKGTAFYQFENFTAKTTSTRNPRKAPKSTQIRHPHKPHLTPPC